MKRCGFVLLGFLWAGVACADEVPVTVASVVSGDEIKLNDGRVVRLAGIKDFGATTQGFLAATVILHDVTLRDATLDRYGRTAATVTLAGQSASLEQTLLGQGLAFVYPATGDDAALAALLTTERAARQNGRGWWATHPDTPSDDAEKLYGSYGFVRGTVVKAERIKNKVYLNFGADWRTDFTIAIVAHDLRAFKNADIDLLTLAGKQVRVRGWIKRDFGPMITITDPHQLEILP